jgi:flagellar capping protein FliD
MCAPWCLICDICRTQHRESVLKYQEIVETCQEIWSSKLKQQAICGNWFHVPLGNQNFKPCSYVPNSSRTLEENVRSVFNVVGTICNKWKQYWIYIENISKQFKHVSTQLKQFQKQFKHFFEKCKHISQQLEQFSKQLKQFSKQLKQLQNIFYNFQQKTNNF